PVLAAPPSTAYRVRKFVRRHWTAVGAGAALLLLTVSAAIALTVLWQRAQHESGRARAEANKAEIIATFLERTLAAGDTWEAGRLDTALLKKMMDQSAQRVRSGELAGAPEAELRLRLSIGRVYRIIGEHAAAHQMLDLTRALADLVAPGDTPLMDDVLAQD